MLFNSYIFILAFLPITLIVYFLLSRIHNHIYAKIWLLCCSLYFYAYFNFSYFFIIITSIIFNYCMNLLLCPRSKKFTPFALKKPFRLMVIVLALVVNVGILFYFKYFDFFITNINSVFGTSFNLMHLVLPLGISFFTFQQLSFVLDSYKKKVPAYNFVDYALFVSFFPQLIAGPIVLHNEIVPQFADPANRRFNNQNFSEGIMAFAIGLFKKAIIADTFSKIVTWGYGSDITTLNSTNALLVMLAYTIQIYFDFSGYCDMATGIGRMFNIRITMNFNSPYKALTIVDFWKRWHITLTRFFTNYLYYPLGGN